MPEVSPVLHFSTPSLAERFDGCSPLLESWFRYCSYLATSALQYAASLDCAYAPAGSENRVAASRTLVSTFMIFSIARRPSDEEMCRENGGSPAFTLPS